MLDEPPWPSVNSLQMLTKSSLSLSTKYIPNDSTNSFLDSDAVP